MRVRCGTVRSAAGDPWPIVGDDQDEVGDGQGPADQSVRQSLGQSGHRSVELALLETCQPCASVAGAQVQPYPWVRSAQRGQKVGDQELACADGGEEPQLAAELVGHDVGSVMLAPPSQRVTGVDGEAASSRRRCAATRPAVQQALPALVLETLNRARERRRADAALEAGSTVVERLG